MLGLYSQKTPSTMLRPYRQHSMNDGLSAIGAEHSRSGEVERSPRFCGRAAALCAGRRRGRSAAHSVKSRFTATSWSLGRDAHASTPSQRHTTSDDGFLSRTALETSPELPRKMPSEVLVALAVFRAPHHQRQTFSQSETHAFCECQRLRRCSDAGGRVERWGQSRSRIGELAHAPGIRVDRMRAAEDPKK
jgi:hypothetical protein